MVKIRHSIPFVTEEDPVGSFLPEQQSRTFVFNYVEEELLAIETELAEPGTNEYGRADKAATWALLAKLYLNAEVYTGEARYTDCITYCNKIINAGCSLSNDYERLFLADNYTQDNEIIFPVVFDGVHTKSFGGTTYITPLFIVGGILGDKVWDNGNYTYIMFRDNSDPNDFNYTYTAQMKAGGFKLVTVLGSWDSQYGLSGDELVANDGGSSDIKVDADGYYTFSINIDELTYSLEPYDAAGATIPRSILPPTRPTVLSTIIRSSWIRVTPKALL